MSERPGRDSISASAVGDFVYCARAHGLRRATDGAADPALAARLAQGLPAGWRPGATARLARRQRERDAQLAGGTLAHHRQHGRLRAAGGLAVAGLLLVGLALALGVLTLVMPTPWAG